MTPSHAQRPLAGPLRARINKLAHLQALQHEIRLKTCLIDQVKSARDGGASFDELSTPLGKLEAARSTGDVN